MSAHWYLFCPPSGLGFLLMEFPWLFFSHPTKMLPFSKILSSSLPPLYSPVLSRSLVHSLPLIYALAPALSLPSLRVSLFFSTRREGTSRPYITVPFFKMQRSCQKGFGLSLVHAPSHLSLSQLKMCLSYLFMLYLTGRGTTAVRRKY